MTIKIWVPGIPAPQGNMAATRQGKLYYKNSANLDVWRYDISWRARKAMRENKIHEVHLGPVALTIEFTLVRPKATPKRRETPPAIKKPDLDKLQRAVLDSLTGHVYQDDSQVNRIAASKRLAEIGETTGATIFVEFIHHAPQGVSR